jgi:hypothetical protein
MAKINTTFGFVDNTSSPLQKMINKLNDAGDSFSNLQRKVITASAAIQAVSLGVNFVKGGISKLNMAMSESIGAYQYQSEQELKLETIMKQRMNATQGDIQAIKDLASAQQRAGIYGDEMILQGAQELASFTSNREAIEELIPAMNNLIAQQYGFNANGQNFQATADMMGKVLSGQTGALSRMGYIFSEEEKQMLKTGNEMERAATLAKIIKDNVGDMNAALAHTDAGQISSVKNNLGDLRENIGKTLLPLQSAISRLSNSINGDKLMLINGLLSKVVPILVSIIDNVNKLYTKFSTFVIKVKNGIQNFIIKNIVKITESLMIVAGTLALLATIWIANHARMLAVTIATNAKILANYLATNAKILASSIATFVATNWQILLVIAVIALLITAWIKCGATFEKAGAVIGKVFGAIYAAGYNAIMALINLFVKLQNAIADSFIGKKMGMQKLELKEYKSIKETMDAGAMKGSQVGKGMDDWIKGLQSKIGTKVTDIKDAIKGSLKTTGNGAIEVSDRNMVDIADDYRELLSKEALNKYNMTYSQVTPQVSMGGITINNGMDVQSMMKQFVEEVQEASVSYLRGE